MASNNFELLTKKLNARKGGWKGVANNFKNKNPDVCSVPQ